MASDAETPESCDLRELCGLLDSMAAHLVTAASKRCRSCAGSSEMAILGLLSADGRNTMKVVGAELELPRSTVTTSVDRLEKKGQVERSAQPGDRRSIALNITPLGNATLDGRSAPRETEHLASHIADTLSSVELRELLRLLHKSVTHDNPSQ